MDEQEAERPPCYCFLWEQDPESLRAQGIPPGYCGMCQVCGKPGHTRHYPGSVPCTGTWCETCYAKLNRGLPLGRIVQVLLLGGLLALVAWMTYAVFRNI